MIYDYLYPNTFCENINIIKILNQFTTFIVASLRPSPKHADGRLK